MIGCVLTWFVTWFYYLKGIREVRSSEQRIIANFHGPPREVSGQLHDIAREADANVRAVRVLVTMTDDEIAETVRRVLGKLQGPDGAVQGSEVIRDVGLPPQASGNLRSVLDMMRRDGEVGYTGEFGARTILRYRPTARKQRG